MGAEGRLPTLVLSGGAVPAPPLVERNENGRPTIEDTAAVAIDALHKSLPEIHIRRHHLKLRVRKSKKLVVKFAACSPNTVRDRVCQGRFSLMNEKDNSRKLFISGSLTPFRQDVCQAPLSAKKAK